MDPQGTRNVAADPKIARFVGEPAPLTETGGDEIEQAHLDTFNTLRRSSRTGV